MTGMKVGCPRCRCALNVNPAEAGRALKCPHCQAMFRLAGPRPSASATPAVHFAAAPLLWAGAAVLVLVGAVVGYTHFSTGAEEKVPANARATASPIPSPAAPQPASPTVVVDARPPAQSRPRVVPLVGDLAAAKRPKVGEVVGPDDEVSAPDVPVPEPKADPPVVVAVEPPPAKPEPVAVANVEKKADVPLTKEEKRVKDAIARGMAYLRKNQHANGSWGNNSYLVGYTSMPALALLEGGASPKDPAVQKAANFVRGYVPNLTATYELGLAILFLDRLGEPRDKLLIQSMALRLVAGQNHVGGWTYHCPLLTVPEERELITFLKRNQPRPPLNPLGPVLPPYLVPVTDPQPGLNDPIAKGKDPLLNPVGKDKEPGTTTNPLAKPADAPLLNPVQNKKEELFNPLSNPGNTRPADDKNLIKPIPEEKTSSLTGATKSGGSDDKDVRATTKSDGFDKPVAEKPKAAVILPKSALKAKDEPGDDSPPGSLINRWPSVPDFVARLRNPTQAAPEPKGKGKGKGKKGGPHVDDNSNSQFAILGLWAARRHGVPMTLTLTRLDERYRSSQVATGGWEYRYMGKGQTAAMTCVGLLGLGLSHGAFHEAMNADGKKDAAPRVRALHADPAIQLGLQALGGYVGVPAGTRPANAPPPAMQNLYFLWSVERVAVLFNLKTLGNKDWYAWGSEILTAHQAADGSWHGGSYPGSNHMIDTCMALLFLRRSNLTRDLSDNLPPYLLVRDPGR